jgi:hypothetical protein
MSCEEFNHLAGGISSIATTLALIVGGIWTYRRFVRTREAYPKIEFTVDLAFVRKQGGFWVVEAIANMENKGLVRHSIRKFTFDLRYMLPSDAVEVSAPFWQSCRIKLLKDHGCRRIGISPLSSRGCAPDIVVSLGFLNRLPWH